MRDILKASRRLRRLGVLTPDSDPTEYFHSIRQWAIWTEENGFNRESFSNAFIDRVKKNFAAAKQPWDERVETTVRGLLPNRWNDISKVLEEASRLRE